MIRIRIKIEWILSTARNMKMQSTELNLNFQKMTPKEFYENAFFKEISEIKWISGLNLDENYSFKTCMFLKILFTISGSVP